MMLENLLREVLTTISLVLAVTIGGYLVALLQKWAALHGIRLEAQEAARVEDRVEHLLLAVEEKNRLHRKMDRIPLSSGEKWNEFLRLAMKEPPLQALNREQLWTAAHAQLAMLRGSKML